MSTSTTTPVTPSSNRPHAAVDLGFGTRATGTELVAVPGDSALTSGRIVWWRLTGAVSRAEVMDFMATVGADLSLAPAMPSPAAALANTLADVGRDFKAIPRPCKDGRWALVREHSGERKRRRVRWDGASAAPASVPPPAGDDTSATEGSLAELAANMEAAETETEASEAEDTSPTVIADPGAPIGIDTLAVVRLVAANGAVSLHVRTLDEKLAVRLHEAFAFYRDALSTREASAWLSRVTGRDLDGISLRDKGGIYYLPPAAVEAWSKVVLTLRACSGHKVSTIPAMTAEDTAAAVLDALQAEADDFVEDTLGRVAELKKGAAATRQTRGRELLAKVSRYEALFGEGRLEALRERLGGLDVTLSTIAVVAGAAT